MKLVIAAGSPRSPTGRNEMESGPPTGKALSASGIRVSYGPREVLHGVDLRLEPGRIHALLGANGSGKSTLVKVLTGRMPPNAGELSVGAESGVRMRSPGDADRLGIRAVQQETPLIDAMSITENYALRAGYPTGSLGRVKWREAHARTHHLLDRLGLDIDPAEKAATVSAANRGLLTIGIALGDDGDAKKTTGKILVLDEATAAIPEKEAFAVLRKVRQLADDGLSVLMVTHRIAEATEFADGMTVLYDGDVAYQDTASIDPDRIIELIVTGRTGAEAASELAPVDHPGIAEDRAVVVEGLKGAGLNDVGFHVHSGEILGIVGGPRSGASEISTALAGLEPTVSGFVTIGGNRTPLPRDPRQAIRRGICLVPRDRLRQGGVDTMSVFENVLLPTARGLTYYSARNRSLVDGVISEFSVTPPEPEARLRELSGGNQQKVIVGKWLARQPRLLILDDPTIGVDPGARRIMFDVVAERCRTDGLGVLLFSSEPEELAQHCHRLLAIEDGRIVDELVGARMDRLAVSAWASK